MGSPPVIVDRPIPNRHLQMAFVERNQEVETFATKAAAESFAHRVRLWGPQRRPQNPYTQIGKTSVDIHRKIRKLIQRLGSADNGWIRDAATLAKRPPQERRFRNDGTERMR